MTLRFVDQSDLALLLEPPTHEYRSVTEIKAGDYVRWWTQDCLVIEVRSETKTCFITIFDQGPGHNLLGEEVTFMFKFTDELLIKKIPAVIATGSIS